MGKYFLNHYRVFDTGNDPDITTAFATGCYFDIKDTLQSSGPCH